MVNLEQYKTATSCKSCNGEQKDLSTTITLQDLDQTVTQEIIETIGEVLNRGRDEIKCEILEKYQQHLVGKKIIVKVQIVPDTQSQTKLSSISSLQKSINDLSENLTITSQAICDPNAPFLCVDEETGEATKCTICCPGGMF